MSRFNFGASYAPACLDASVDHYQKKEVLVQTCMMMHLSLSVLDGLRNYNDLSIIIMKLKLISNRLFFIHMLPWF